MSTPPSPEFAELRLRIGEMDRRIMQAIDYLTARVFQQFDSDHTALQAALMSQEKAVAAALQAAKEAVDKAEAAASKRFDSTNEFRLQLADQQATFVRADVLDARLAALTGRIEVNAAHLARMQLAQAQGVGEDVGSSAHRADTRAEQAEARAVSASRYMLIGMITASLSLVATIVLKFLGA